MFNKLTTFGKICVIAIILCIVGTTLYFAGSKLNVKLPSVGGNSDYDATIMVNTYCGFEPIVWGNGGLEGKDDSYFAQKFGVKLKIIIMDDFEASRAALKNDEAQIAYCTLDALPVEMSSSGTMTDMRYFMLLNFSAGADALVANNSIANVGDLKGKSVAFAEGTASHTLLINTLETSGLSQSDIKLVKVGSGLEARDAFKEINSQIPVDKRIKVAAIFSYGANEDLDEIGDEHSVELLSRCIVANAFETEVDFALASSSKINYATLADELNWMGLNSTYNGMTGERIYKKMSIIYSGLGLCKSPLSWNKVAYTDIIESLSENNSLDNKQDETGTKAKSFTAPTAEMETTEAISNKKVTINFPTAGYTLDNDARTIIDREFVDIAQQFSNSRIRVEGNTDNTGNYESNVSLSKKRAQAVVDYLVNEYGMDRNRFIVVGNGPKFAVKDGVNGADERYRRTDFNLIAD